MKVTGEIPLMYRLQAVDFGLLQGWPLEAIEELQCNFKAQSQTASKRAKNTLGHDCELRKAFGNAINFCVLDKIVAQLVNILTAG